MIIESASSKVDRIRYIGRTIRQDFAQDSKHIFRDDRAAARLLYCCTVLVGVVFSLMFWPSLVGHSTATAILVSVALAFLVIPLIGSALVLTILLSYNVFNSVVDASQDARQSHRDLRRAALYASRWMALSTKGYRKFQAAPIFLNLADPSKEFARFDKLRSDVRKSYQFMERSAANSHSSLRTRILVRKARRKQVSADRRLNAMYQTLYTGIIHEYKNSLIGPIQQDTTDSVWILPSSIGSIYSVRILEKYVDTIGTLSANDRRPAPHVRLVFSPAWVCEMVSQLEISHRGSIPPSFWRQHSEPACVPLRGADRETMAKLYDPKGAMSDLNTLIDITLYI